MILHIYATPVEQLLEDIRSYSYVPSFMAALAVWERLSMKPLNQREKMRQDNGSGQPGKQKVDGSANESTHRTMWMSYGEGRTPYTLYYDRFCTLDTF
jgi:hypothetical protein